MGVAGLDDLSDSDRRTVVINFIEATVDAAAIGSFLFAVYVGAAFLTGAA